MASWDQVRGHLRGQWQVERDDPSAFAILCPIQVGDRTVLQAVGLAPTEVHGRPWLQMIGELFVETALSTRTALTYADRLPFGAVVLRNERYLLRHGAALDVLQLVDLDWTVKVFAHEAVRLRVNLVGPASAQVIDAFGNYAE